MDLKFAWFLCGFLVSLLWLNTSVTSLTCHFSICSKTANSNNRWRCDRFPWGNRTDCNGSNRICTTLSFRRDQGPLTGRGLRGSFRTQTCASSACDICTSHKYPNCAQRCCNTDLCNTAPALNEKKAAKTTFFDKKKIPKEVKELMDDFKIFLPK